jgi:hypothetical protein
MLSVASGHILYAQLRTLRWLITVQTWGFLLVLCFIVHTTCYCMDAIYLGGNVWIKNLYALVSVSCESMTIQPSV